MQERDTLQHHAFNETHSTANVPIILVESAVESEFILICATSKYEAIERENKNKGILRVEYCREPL